MQWAQNRIAPVTDFSGSGAVHYKASIHFLMEETSIYGLNLETRVFRWQHLLKEILKIYLIFPTA